MIKQFDTIKSIIPDWILDDNPQFYYFLKEYYQWMSDRAYDQTYLYNHMDYMFLKKELDSYVDSYLDGRYPSIPNELMRDHTFMVRWSNQLNSMKGSPDIYHLLFFLFFDNEVVISYPSSDVLKISGAKWIKSKKVIYVTIHNKSFAKSSIVQDIKVVDGEVKTFGVFDVLQLELDKGYTNIIDPTKAVITTNDDEEYLLETSNSVQVVNGGSKHYVNEILFPQTAPSYELTITATATGSVEIPISFNSFSNMTVTINGNKLFNYTVDDGVLYSTFIEVGSVINITTTGYSGEIQVTKVDNNGAVTEAVAYKPFIGHFKSNVKVDDCEFKLSVNVVNTLQGYYEDGYSRLDDRDKLQDSDYYQDYSYDISSTTIPESYRVMVKGFIHPAGYKIFTTALNDFNTSKMAFMRNVEDEVDIDTVEFNRTAIRALGNNYKTACYSSGGSFSLPSTLTTDQINYMKGEKGYLGYDYDMLCKMLIEEAYYIIYADDGSNNNNYDENSISDVTNYIKRNYIDPKYFNDVSSLYYATVGTEASSASLYIPYTYIEEGYFKLDLSKIKDTPKGWMTRSSIAYVDFYYEQHYTVEYDTGDTYFESGYVKD